MVNKDLGQAHLVIRFEDQAIEALNGIIIDNVTPEQSEKIAPLKYSIGKTQLKLGDDNIGIPKLFEAIGTVWDFKDLRHWLKLNQVVEASRGDMKAITSRVVLSGDGSSGDTAGKTMAMVPEFRM